MIGRVLLVALGIALASTTAQAQTYFSNPFATPAAERAARGETPNATVRYHYDVSHTERGGAAVTSQMTIDVAADWALVREGQRTMLYDFRRNRLFDINGAAHTFVSYNALASPGFRLGEYVNRGMLSRVLAAARVPAGQESDVCDAANELGLITPGVTLPGVTLNARLQDTNGVATLQCNGRNLGSIRLDSGAAPPAALWPTLANEMSSYPLLLQHARQSGHAPAQLNITFRIAPGVPATQRSFRLTATDSVATPYPLTDDYTNATAAKIDEFMPGAGTLGAEAVAGRAAGGPPTLQSWNRHLDDVARRDGLPAGGMLMAPTVNMFPEITGSQCSGPAAPLCAKLGGLRAIAAQDPAVLAVFQVADMEQQHNAAGVIAAMQSAQSSPNRNHPVLGASYGLALLWFNDDARRQAQAAGLPIDPVPLEARVLALLPYNPPYWTDVGDRFVAAYEWQKALAFFDIAFSLPMPSAVQSNPALASKRGAAAQIIQAAPDFFLPQ